MPEKGEIIHRPTWKEQNYLPQRYVVAMMSFCGMSCVYMLRININLAIVAMVHSTNSSNNSAVENDECGFTDNSTASNGYEGEFAWDEMTQSLILGSFFWGYIWTQIPGGRLAEVFGAKRVYGSAVCASAFLTLLIPLAANCNYQTLIALRILMGVSQGACFPSTHALLSSWAPPNERSTLSALVYAGSQFGTIIGYPLTGVILDSFGWEAVFYIQGAMAIAWTVLWALLVSDGPRDARWITDTEKEYILSSIGDSKKKEAPPVPWAKAATSLPMWAILLAGVGNNWGFYTLLTDLPLYMKEMLKQDISSNAMLSAMPYVGMLVFSILISNLADFMRRKNLVSTVVVRKVANTIAHVGPAICLVSLSLVECDLIATISLLCLAVTLQGGIYTGFMVNHIDIAPNFAGTLFGITNAAATIPAWLAPMTVGALTNGNQTLAQWRKVFYIAAAIFVADALFYVIFASGVEQDWNRIHENTDDNLHSSKNVDAASKNGYPLSEYVSTDSTPDKANSNTEVSCTDDNKLLQLKKRSLHDQVHKTQQFSATKQDEVYDAYVLNPYPKTGYATKALPHD